MGAEDFGSAADVQGLECDLLVPQSLVVPTGDERWPLVTWGYKLGRAVSQLRYKLENKSPLPAGMKEELERMSFVRNVAQYKWDNSVLRRCRGFIKSTSTQMSRKNLSQAMTKRGQD
ncbi:hypothetical protein PHYSODRAFT_330255 [Phytophthora sojae]|uniref:Uncharacterized protein n=1 Tax=Phytophthora sojae (strain P6497) TaxID=1094619 RepID=G4Z776_PHYSP|nr:hypothetical protein PHYSODRAFT_330255 [Phytophthora sojae]EGZ22460.1 hypothetical protein PHYSODRAFT_330255 [Phytophthora sojae]|eukprot:XP_009525177.1 hypothetical protein PHYSODRAFT_330255 [Phytophthora sojae]